MSDTPTPNPDAPMPAGPEPHETESSATVDHAEKLHEQIRASHFAKSN